MFKPVKRKYKAIGINIYGGGFTLGVLKSFQVLGQWEQCNLGKRTFDLNFENIPRPLDIKDWPVKEFKNKVDFVFANPPCAPWSIANNHIGKTKESRFEDKRLQLTYDTMHTAVKLNPDIFISESVENAYNIGSSHYDQYVELWLKHGYAVTYFLTDAILLGSPSARRRFHFIAHKYAINIKEPDMDNFTPTTVKDAIWDLKKKVGETPLHSERSTNKYHKKHMPMTVPGGRLRDATERDPNYPGPKVSFLCKRFVWDSPCSTMVGFHFIHPNGKRWITFREALRLCTYPDEFICENAIEAVDAVLPIVSTFLAKKAKQSLKLKKPCKKEFNIIDHRPLALKYHMRFNKRKAVIKFMKKQKS